MMNDNELQILEEEKEEDIVFKIIFNTYMEIFHENIDEMNKREKIKEPKRAIPQISDIHQRIMDDIDEKALEIIYGVSKDMFSFEKINDILLNHNCVFRWSSFVVGDAQTRLFGHEMFDSFGEEYDLLLK